MADGDSHNQEKVEASEIAPDGSSSPIIPSAKKGRRRSSYATRDLTEGSVPKNLWFLAWPQIAESAISVVDQFADLVWAGRLGIEAMAAVGVGQPLITTAMTARMGFDAGMRAMISRAIGARQFPYANHVFFQSLNLTTIFVLIVVSLGVVFAGGMLRLLGVSENVISQAEAYLQVQFVAMGLVSFHRMTAGALQAAGDSMIPLRAATFTRVVHLVFSPILIFGWVGFPELGLVGASLARVGAELIGITVNVFVLFRGTSRMKPSIRQYRVDFGLMWRLVKLGSPAAVTNMQRGFSQLLMVRIMAPFGDVALAAFSITRRSENLVTHGSRGLGRAAGALAGQNLGVGHTERAKSAMRWAVLYVAGGSLSITALILIFPEAFAGFFNPNEEFVQLAARFMMILAIGYFSMSAVQVFTQGFNTSGDTMAPMIITLSTVWIIDLPLGFALSYFTPIGQAGVIVAIVIGMTVRLGLFVIHYLRGTWLKTGLM